MADRDELLMALYEAQEHIYEAIEQLEWYVGETDDQNTKAYIVDHLKIMVSGDHGFMSRDKNLGDVIEAFSSDSF